MLIAMPSNSRLVSTQMSWNIFWGVINLHLDGKVKYFTRSLKILFLAYCCKQNLLSLSHQDVSVQQYRLIWLAVFLQVQQMFNFLTGGFIVPFSPPERRRCLLLSPESMLSFMLFIQTYLGLYLNKNMFWKEGRSRLLLNKWLFVFVFFFSNYKIF